MAAGAVLIGTGCSGGGGDTRSDAAETPAPPAVASSADADRAATGGSAAEPAPAGQVVAVSRELVSTASMTVVTKEVDQAAAAAEAAVTERGGFVFGQEDSASQSDSATLTLKVPPKEFRPLLASLAALGKVEHRSVATDDVTAEGVDLDARILSAQKSVDRVRGFLDETKNVTELSGVEAELTRRESELEQLVGQRRVLDDRVALATVSLTLRSTPVPAPPAGDSLRSVPGFGGALASGVGGVVKVGRVAGAGVGYVLPFAVVLGLPALVLRAVGRRRRGGRHTGPTGPTGPTPSVMDPSAPPPVAPIA